MSTIVQPRMERPRRGGFVGPLFLIGLGFVLLMNTLGIWGWDVWWALIQLWPLFLIAAGLDLLFGRRSVGAGVLVLVITALMFAVGIWYVSSNTFGGGAFREQALGQLLGSAERAEISLEAGVGTLRVSEATDNEQLVTGNLELAVNEEATETFEMEGDTAIYRLETRGAGSVRVLPFWPRGNEKTWAIQLNGETPMVLSISTGVGEAFLDLRELDITELTLNTGVGQTEVTLPESGDYRALIEAGIGEVTVRAPDGLAARITVSTGLGDVKVRGNFERVGDAYVSPGWESAQNRATIHIDAGIGEVELISE